jgi:hypothetical protein
MTISRVISLVLLRPRSPDAVLSVAASSPPEGRAAAETRARTAAHTA